MTSTDAVALDTGDIVGNGAGPSVARSPALTGRIAAHVATVETRLSRELDDLVDAWDRGCPDSNVSYSANLPMLLREFLHRGGKRTRPMMTLLGWVAGDVRGRERGYADMVTASCALEMLHCFALVHDDVMDESVIRRGRPTVHEQAARLHDARRGLGSRRRFGDSIAVLTGDLAHSEAERLAAALPTRMRRVWREMILELIAGQTWDIVGSATADRRTEHARSVARQKTGYYTVARPLQLGALAADAASDALIALARYGQHAGEAFALRDDILGAFGDPSVTGKPAGDDIRLGKTTVLLALAATRLRGPAATALNAAGTCDMTDAQVTMVQDAMIDDGVVDVVERMIDDRVGDALAALSSVELAREGAAGLADVLSQLARRDR